MSGLVAGSASSSSSSSSSGAAPGFSGVCLYFYADWHPSHSQLSAVFKALVSVCPLIEFKSIPAETTPSLVDKYGVNVVPTTILCTNNGTVFAKIDTADVAEITRQVTLLNKTKSETSSSENLTENLTENLISSSASPPPSSSNTQRANSSNNQSSEP